MSADSLASSTFSPWLASLPADWQETWESVQAAWDPMLDGLRVTAGLLAGSALLGTALALALAVATAMGPQKALRVRGIMARTAAAAVNTIGRKRRTAAPTMASQAGTPCARSVSIWSIRAHRCWLCLATMTLARPRRLWPRVRA